jgi:metal transporter CNNM
MSEVGGESSLPTWANLVLGLGLICLSALFSGLTLGLLSLDKASLEILAASGTSLEQQRAKQIIPLRKDGNLLLSTMVLGNVIVNNFLSILLAGLTSGLVGLLASTALIVIFGEIAPQAAGSRHGLAIGANTRFITLFFLVVLYPVAKPISLALDFALGEETVVFYTKAELQTLLRMQVKDHIDSRQGSGIVADDHALLVGAFLHFSEYYAPFTG